MCLLLLGPRPIRPIVPRPSQNWIAVSPVDWGPIPVDIITGEGVKKRYLLLKLSPPWRQCRLRH